MMAGRLANFSRGQVGEVIYLDGNTNYKIYENDLLATGIVIHTGGQQVHKYSVLACDV